MMRLQVVFGSNDNLKPSSTMRSGYGDGGSAGELMVESRIELGQEISFCDLYLMHIYISSLVWKQWLTLLQLSLADTSVR